MVAIAQLVERQIVVLDVAGSSPVSHPSNRLVCKTASKAIFIGLDAVFAQSPANKKSGDPTSGKEIPRESVSEP